MFSLFQRKSHIDNEFLQWTIGLSKWTVDNFDGLEQIRKTPLVKPTPEFYPPSKLTGHDRAKELFAQTKEHADMSDWACSLVAQSHRAPYQLGDSVLQKFESNAPAGTFSESAVDGEIHSQITYDPTLLAKPVELVATFSHELAHLLMTSARTPLPFAEGMEEPATDGLAIMMGFGIFILNGSSGFHANDQGWEYHRSGYLCEGEILHAFSAFCILSGTKIEEAKPFLKSHHYKRLSNIFREMDKQSCLQILTADEFPDT